MIAVVLKAVGDYSSWGRKVELHNRTAILPYLSVMITARPFIILSLCMLVFALGCKKDTDDTPPEVSITSPSFLSDYNALGMVLISGTATDEQALEYVELSIRDLDFRHVVPAVTLTPSSSEFTFSQGVSLDDIHLASGRYYAVVTADDGENQTREFVEIEIFEVPQQTKAILSVTQSSGNVLDVHSIDANDNSTLYYSFPNTNFGGSAVNSYHQQFSVIGSGDGDLQTIETEYVTSAWSVPEGLSGSFPYFTEIDFDREDRLTYVSISNGNEVRGYDKNGSMDVQAFSVTGYMPETVIGHEEYLLIEENEVGGNTWQLTTRFRSSGAFHQSTFLPVDAIGMFSREENEVLIFGNASGQAEMHLYYVSGSSFWNVHGLPTGVLNDVTAIDQNTYLLAHQTGLYVYTYNNNSLVPLATGFNANHVAWDEVNNRIWVASGSTLYKYDSAGNQQGTVSQNSTVLDLHVLYNK